MTPDPTLAARLAEMEAAIENHGSSLTFACACGDAYRSGQLITAAERDAAVQAAVEVERAQIADIFHPEQLTVWSSEILGDLSIDGSLNIQDYGAKVSAYDIVARHLQVIAAAIRARTARGDETEGER